MRDFYTARNFLAESAVFSHKEKCFIALMPGACTLKLFTLIINSKP